ncbi:MAG TPA: PEP/pyruvate-binding domain-containing protein [Dehalococcoidia bacterium]|nr:PEP/pyruvate-binding domain-containing protein [Dehalococcoidia bacterium]
MSYIVWMNSGKLSREEVGGKGSSLAELISAGFKVPAGFVVTADAYRHFASSTGIAGRISEALAKLDASDLAAVRHATELITGLVREMALPEDLKAEVTAAYEELSSSMGSHAAVRSSAISEDGSAASFAGLYDSYLNMVGADEVLDAVHRCYVSLWAERAVSYRAGRTDAADEAMAVVVMKLVPSETSGIAFTAHPVTGSLDQVIINSSFGLGEAVVSGQVTPDSFLVDKNSFGLLEREIYPKELAIYPHPEGGGGTVEERLSPDRQREASLTDEQACEVARLAADVEKHYGSPQDIEWALYQGTLYLLQSRPITTL